MKNFDYISQYLCKRTPPQKKKKKRWSITKPVHRVYTLTCLVCKDMHLLAQFSMATALQKLLAKRLGREGV